MFNSRLFTWVAAALMALVLGSAHLIDVPREDTPKRKASTFIEDEGVHPTPDSVFQRYAELGKKL